MKIKKKTLYSIGVLGMVAAPVATVISCGNISIDTSLFKWEDVQIPSGAYLGTNGAGSIDVTKVTGIPEHSEVSYTKKGQSDVNPKTLSDGEQITLTLSAKAGYKLSESVLDQNYTIPPKSFKIDTSKFQWPTNLIGDYIGTNGSGSIDLTKITVPKNSEIVYQKKGDVEFTNPKTLSNNDIVVLKLQAKPGYELSDPVLNKEYTISSDTFKISINMAGWDWPDATTKRVESQAGNYTIDDMKQFLDLATVKFDNIRITHKVNTDTNFTEGAITGLVTGDKVTFKLEAKEGYTLTGWDAEVTNTSEKYTVTNT